jgi:hypothetical protein
MVAWSLAPAEPWADRQMKTNRKDQGMSFINTPHPFLGKFVFLVKQSFACPIVSMRIYIGRFDRWREIT